MTTRERERKQSAADATSRIGAVGWASLPRRVLALALAGDAFCLAAYSAVAFAGLTKLHPLWDLVDLNQEANLPTWWSTIQLMTVAALLFALASPLFREHPRVGPFRRVWLVLAAGFTFLSADEGGVVHERLSRLMSMSVGIAQGGAKHAAVAGFLQRLGFKGSFHGGGIWIPLYLLVAIGLAVWLAPLVVRVIRTWPKQVLLFAAGFCVLLFGAVILEGITYYLHPVRAMNLLEVGVEETLELCGASIVLFATSTVLARSAAEMQASSAEEDEVREDIAKVSGL